jgi:apolipoprotein D and lipocalin family protein
MLLFLFSLFAVCNSARIINPGVCPPPDFESVTSFSPSHWVEAPWYVVQQAPTLFQPVKNLFCVRADYSVLPNNEISVHNQENKGSVSGPLQNATLRAVYVDAATGKFKVGPDFVPRNFFGPYWVIATDSYPVEANFSGYEWAIVSAGPPSARSNGKCKNTGFVNNVGLWLFSRTPVPSHKTVQTMRSIASERGFDVSILVNVQQDKCTR